jgi:hypothetical protein
LNLAADLPLDRMANLVAEIGEEDSKSEDKRNLADIRRYRVRHGIIVADEIWKRAR